MSDSQRYPAGGYADSVEGISLDGVRYALLENNRILWRVGTVNPRYLQHMPVTSVLDGDEVNRLADEGIWLGRRDMVMPSLAVMCCGQGSQWPGMGRELYDAFPAARAAMDRIAACADWDVLALLDETDPEVLKLTRWQQPYLFLLEYAQWSVYRDLGLEPDIICGHSLGELIALCLAGVYSPEACWHILDTRSRHMADLEAKAASDTGMLAVYADEGVLAEVRTSWPEVYVSNFNTPRQFILSGPRPTLMEIRKAMRKRRHPAILLPMALAFHHPSMRVLRDLSYRRLCGLEMHAPETPMLSCVTTGFYPGAREDICRYIVDLDENSVRWVECVRNMWQRDGVRHFLEVGPMDTLGTLVAENEPQALCLASSMRGHELDCMRRTLARLFADGHLSKDRIASVRATRPDSGQDPMDIPAPPAESQVADPFAPKAEEHPVSLAVRTMIAGATGRDVAEVRPGMDLRFDLAMRSSQFPRLMDEVEKQLGISVGFEDLLQVSTVGDLIRALSGKAGVTVAEEESAHRPLGMLRPLPHLCRCRRVQEKGKLPAWREVPLRPVRKLFRPGPTQVLGIYGVDDALAGELLTAVLPTGMALLLGDGLPRIREKALSLGCQTLDLCLAGVGLERALVQAEHIDVMLVGGAACAALSEDAACAFSRELVRVGCQTLVLVRQATGTDVLEETYLSSAAARVGIRFLDIGIFAGIPHVVPNELGDFFARELCCADASSIAWVPSSDVAEMEQPYLDDSDASPQVHPLRILHRERHPMLLQAEAVYSRAGEPALGCAGRTASGEHRLPEIFAIRSLLHAASMLMPWLEPCGICDIHFLAETAERGACVREARIDCNGMAWISNDGVQGRKCFCSHAVRALSVNGRRQDRWEESMDGIVLMAGPEHSLDVLWEDDFRASECDVDLDAWYASQDLGTPWRIAEEVRIPEKGCLSMKLSEQSFIALGGAWQYNRTLSAIEAVLQAARMSMDLDPPAAYVGPRVPYMAGFVLFGKGDWDGPRRLLLKRRWDAATTIRFDAQVTDAQGRCLVCVHHLEFSGAAVAAADN